MKGRRILFILAFTLLFIIGESIDKFLLINLPFTRYDPFPEVLVKFDSDIFIFINQHLGNPWLDMFMRFITYSGSTVFWLITVVILWFYDRRKEASLLATAMIMGGILFLFLKFFIARPRPYQMIDGTRIIDLESGSSFPSGHAKNIFSAAAILGNSVERKWTILLYLLAVLVSFSRIYVGMHYPFDVIIGGFLGYVIGRVTLMYEGKIMRMINRVSN